MKFNIHLGYREWWMLFGAILISISAFLLFKFLDVIVYGIFIYYIARPIYTRINSRTGSKDIGILISLLFFVLPVVFLGVYTLGIALSEADSLVKNTEFLQWVQGSYVEFLTGRAEEFYKSVDMGYLFNILKEHGKNIIDAVLEYISR